MATEPDDKWSYGVSANRPSDQLWPPPAGADAGEGNQPAGGPAANEQPAPPAPPGPTAAYTSPSLGAYGRPGASVAQSGDDTGADDDYDGDRNPYASNGEGDEYFASFDDDLDDFDPGELEVAGDARRNAIEWVVVLVGAVLLALILRAILLQAFWIPSPSMESTLLVRDRVLVNKVSYRLHDIHRGDVIVFRRTEAEIAANPDLPRDVIKRVIGLEGETVEIADSVVTINGNRLIEPYLDEGVVTSSFGPEVVPEGHVFVMGDNRELSLDSRFETGPIAHDRVVGRAFFLFWPLGRMSAL